MTKPKPKHLQPEYGEQFSDQSEVNAYRYRSSYPDEVFDVLRDADEVLPPGAFCR